MSNVIQFGDARKKFIDDTVVDNVYTQFADSVVELAVSIISEKDPRHAGEEELDALEHLWETSAEVLDFLINYHEGD